MSFKIIDEKVDEYKYQNTKEELIEQEKATSSGAITFETEKITENNINNGSNEGFEVINNNKFLDEVSFILCNTITKFTEKTERLYHLYFKINRLWLYVLSGIIIMNLILCIILIFK